MIEKTGVLIITQQLALNLHPDSSIKSYSPLDWGLYH